jgi:glycosyltransferase involved in cell wall biosynthesis
MKKLISYVVPFYFDQGNVHALYDALIKTTSQIKYSKKYDYEFIFVNDGSTDNTLTELYEVAKADDRVTIVNLARNYGHQIAVTAGLDEVNGDAVIIMDSDLQDPPRVSLELIDKWEDGYDVVYAQRRTRKDGFLKKVTANIYYRLLHTMADIDIPRNTGDFRLIDRKVVEELKKYKEHNRYLRGLVSYIGFKQAPVLFDRDERFAGESGYSFKRLMQLAKDGIFGFSSIPLKMISRLGFAIAAASVVAIIYAICYKLFSGAVVEGWAFIVISIFFIGGIQLVMLGVLGSYIGRIYTEVQNRPLYGVEARYNAKNAK